jgi:hypothetical protein
MAGDDPTWVARLTPPEGGSVAELLGLPLGLDVWERHADALVVAAPESTLAELERRRLARVERWATQQQYQADVQAGRVPGSATGDPVTGREQRGGGPETSG